MYKSGSTRSVVLPQLCLQCTRPTQARLHKAKVYAIIRILRDPGYRLSKAATAGEVGVPTQNVRNPVGPDQLSMLQKVFDQACVEHNITKSSPEGEALPVILVHSMQMGFSEQAKLEALAQILGEGRE